MIILLSLLLLLLLFISFFTVSDGVFSFISCTSHSFWSYIKYFPEDSCRSQYADLLGLCHISSLWYPLDVFYHTLLYSAKCTNNHRDHFSFHLPHSLVFVTLGLCTYFFLVSFRAIFLSNGIDISISLQVEFIEPLMMISVLFAVIVLSVLTGMSHMIMILLSLLCITDSGLCSYHFSIITSTS